jgi:hypothetical protein
VMQTGTLFCYAHARLRKKSIRFSLGVALGPCSCTLQQSQPVATTALGQVCPCIPRCLALAFTVEGTWQV